MSHTWRRNEGARGRARARRHPARAPKAAEPSETDAVVLGGESWSQDLNERAARRARMRARDLRRGLLSSSDQPTPIAFDPSDWI